MNDLEMLTGQLRLNPLETSLRAMWQDEYVALHGCTGAEAKRECAYVWMPALQKWQQESASVLVHEWGRVHDHIRWHIRRRTNWPTPRTTVIAVALGSAGMERPDADIRWHGAVTSISYAQLKSEVVLHRIYQSPAFHALLVGAGHVLAIAAEVGIVWEYPSPAELERYREQEQSADTAADGTDQPDQADQADAGEEQ